MMTSNFMITWGYSRGNKRIRQGAMQPETSCELLHNWSVLLRISTGAITCTISLDTRCIHIIIQAASANWMVWADPKWMDSKPSASSLLNQSLKWQCLVATAWILTYCTSSSWDSRSVSDFYLGKTLKKWLVKFPRQRTDFQRSYLAKVWRISTR